MTLHVFFPTLVYTAPLQSRGARELNRQLLKESRQLREDDAAGRRWSRKNYPGGYTSYGSAHRLHRISPTFEALMRKLERHVKSFAGAVQWNLGDRKLAMTDCWINIMPRQTVHSLHLHPLSTLSGTYYVDVPRGASGLKFEDPRLDRFMASPPREAWISIAAKPGNIVLFESWLRHEVVPNQTQAERVSVSFNYNWF